MEGELTVGEESLHVILSVKVLAPIEDDLHFFSLIESDPVRYNCKRANFENLQSEID